MVKNIIICITLLLTQSAYAQDFVTVWKTDNPYVIDDIWGPQTEPAGWANNQITIPTIGTGYNYDIDWGDGNSDFGVTGNITHTYASPGTYTVRISGDFPRIYFNFGIDKDKLISIEQWGGIQWTSFENAFRGCTNLVINATDTPDLSNVTSLFNAFHVCDSLVDLGPSGNDWDTSNITQMGRMFGDSHLFNADISNWDVSNVFNIGAMFVRTSFNQDISSWNTASLENIGYAFRESPFNQDLGSWDASKITNSLFAFAFSGMSIQNYDATLEGWASQPVSLMNSKGFGAEEVRYCQSEESREILDIEFQWNITDGGLECIYAEFDTESSSDDEASGGNLPVILINGEVRVESTVVVSDAGTGTATEGVDYQFASPQIITIPAGVYDGTTATAISIPNLVINDDTEFEDDETIDFVITNVTDDLYSGDADLNNIVVLNSTYTISNDDPFVPDVILESPVYLIWNSFFNQINITALANKSDNPLDVTATVLDLDGNQLTSGVVTIPANGEFDLIVNDIPGYSSDTYGLVRIEFDRARAFEGHSALYSPSTNLDQSIDFAIIRPFENRLSGTNYLFFNTFQPSLNPSTLNNGVPNWVQIGNTDFANEETFTVNKYSIDGSLIQSIEVTIPPQGRRDVDGGHIVPGPNNVGLIEIIPNNPLAQYTAQISQYGLDAPFNVEATRADWAIDEQARAGSNATQSVKVSKKDNSYNWLAVANTENTQNTINLKLYDISGNELLNQNMVIPAFAQKHISMDSYLSVNGNGVAVLSSTTGGGFIANSRTYYYDNNGDVTTTDKLVSREGIEESSCSIYNSFFNQDNFLNIFNTAATDASVEVSTWNLSGDLIDTQTLTIGANKGNSSKMDIAENVYGQVCLTTNNPFAIRADISRETKLDTFSNSHELIKSLDFR